jgi:hypothetical protein
VNVAVQEIMEEVHVTIYALIPYIRNTSQ